MSKTNKSANIFQTNKQVGDKNNVCHILYNHFCLNGAFDNILKVNVGKLFRYRFAGRCQHYGDLLTDGKLAEFVYKWNKLDGIGRLC